MKDEERIETRGAVCSDEPVGYAAEPTQQLDNDHLVEIWGIKYAEMKIRETQQKKGVAKIT